MVLIPEEPSLQEDRKKFVQKITEKAPTYLDGERINKKAAQYEAIRRIDRKGKNIDQMVEQALNKLQEPYGQTHGHWHLVGMDRSIEAALTGADNKLKEENWNPQVRKVVLAELRDSMITKREIHQQDWNPALLQNMLRVKTLVSKAKRLARRKEKIRNKIFE